MRLCACGCGAATLIAKKTQRSQGAIQGEPQRYVIGHSTRNRRLSPAGVGGPGHRLEDRGYSSPCWIFAGHIRPNGYAGTMYRRGHGARPGMFAPAYRVYYEHARGPIPPGLTLDHLCRQPACVNPEHLEPVTIGENVRRGRSPSADNARKTSCHRGHPLDGVNLYRASDGTRHCRECRRAFFQARKREEED